jgi:deoxyribodipyrimidine photo-lyase
LTSTAGASRAALVWFRNDLRLADNPALMTALAEAEQILAVFVLDEAAAGDARLGGASRWWLHHSLASLARDLHAKGAKLVLRRGDARKIIPELAARVNAVSVHAARAHEPGMRAVDRDVGAALRAAGVAFKRYLSTSLFAPEQIKTKTGGDFAVFTPFSRACLEAGVADDALKPPAKIPGVAHVASDHLDDWHLLPSKPDWAGGLRDAWHPGEAGAADLLARFVADGIKDYHEARDVPGREGTSRLSPHLHFGEISPRTVWHAGAQAGAGKGPQTFLKELLWREFSMYLLWHHPQLDREPIRAEFAKMPWRQDAAGLRAWQRGQTGLPIVDAGMRQLWQTGWMHNRVRMITASFLVKHLLIKWQDGEAWFWDTLAEADLAANSASWQWVAGCGADAAPYFRIFNPVLQGKKFDPDGAYVRRYVPELAALPDEFIHTPWEAGEEILTSARVRLGMDYPAPIIALAEGRERALAAYGRIRG